MEKLYLAALQMASGLGCARIKALLRYFSSAQEAWEADKKELILSKALGETICSNLVTLRQKLDIQELGGQWQKKEIKLCSIDEEEYPSLLKHISNPPYILYYRGTFPQTEKMIAIVGSRQATAYGKNAARTFAANLASEKICIVSGAARGIDTASHQGALAAGQTIAVLGCGVDVVYPPENGGLLETIAENGAVVSEYAPGTPPHHYNFPSRNRIISGMSKGVVIVEAGERSGALITADFALDEGRDVFVIPGGIFSETSKGTNKLIKNGAKLVDGVQDVLEEYDWDYKSESKKDKYKEMVNSTEKPDQLQISGQEKIVYEALECETALSMEEIVLKTNLQPTEVACALLNLGLKDLVTELSGRRYIRNSYRLGGK